MDVDMEKSEEIALYASSNLHASERCPQESTSSVGYVTSNGEEDSLNKTETNTFGNGDLLQFAMQELSGDGKGQQLPVELDSVEAMDVDAEEHTFDPVEDLLGGGDAKGVHLISTQNPTEAEKSNDIAAEQAIDDVLLEAGPTNEGNLNGGEVSHQETDSGLDNEAECMMVDGVEVDDNQGKEAEEPVEQSPVSVSTTPDYETPASYPAEDKVDLPPRESRRRSAKVHTPVKKSPAKNSEKSEKKSKEKRSKVQTEKEPVELDLNVIDIERNEKAKTPPRKIPVITLPRCRKDKVLEEVEDILHKTVQTVIDLDMDAATVVENTIYSTVQAVCTESAVADSIEDILLDVVNDVVDMERGDIEVVEDVLQRLVTMVSGKHQKDDVINDDDNKQIDRLVEDIEGEIDQLSDEGLGDAMVQNLLQFKEVMLTAKNKKLRVCLKLADMAASLPHAQKSTGAIDPLECDCQAAVVSHYHCFYCSRLTADDVSMLEHMNHVHGHWMYHCWCQKRFLTSHSLDAHVIQWREFHAPLEVCIENYEVFPAIFKRLALERCKCALQSRVHFHCNWCDYRHVREDTMMQHMESDHQSEIRTCHHCRAHFNNDVALDYHLKKTKCGNKNATPKKPAAKSSQAKEQLDVPDCSCTARRERHFHCLHEPCDFISFDRGATKKHIYARHTSFICSCGERFAARRDRTTHINREGHSEKDEELVLKRAKPRPKKPKDYKVTREGAIDVTECRCIKSDVLQHFHCPFSGCKTSFGKLLTLNNHLDNAHFNYVYKCSCDLRFFEVKDFRKHKKKENHTEVELTGVITDGKLEVEACDCNDYSGTHFHCPAPRCDFASQSSTRKSTWQHVRKTHHAQIKTCICGFEFLQKSDLTRHIKGSTDGEHDEEDEEEDEEEEEEVQEAPKATRGSKTKAKEEPKKSAAAKKSNAKEDRRQSRGLRTSKRGHESDEESEKSSPLRSRSGRKEPKVEARSTPRPGPASKTRSTPKTAPKSTPKTTPTGRSSRSQGPITLDLELPTTSTKSSAKKEKEAEKSRAGRFISLDDLPKKQPTPKAKIGPKSKMGPKSKVKKEEEKPKRVESDNDKELDDEKEIDLDLEKIDAPMCKCSDAAANHRHCPYCDFTTRLEVKHMTFHVKSKHSELVEACTCGETFLSARNLRIHKKKCSGKKPARSVEKSQSRETSSHRRRSRSRSSDRRRSRDRSRRRRSDSRSSSRRRRGSTPRRFMRESPPRRRERDPSPPRRYHGDDRRYRRSREESPRRRRREPSPHRRRGPSPRRRSPPAGKRPMHRHPSPMYSDDDDEDHSGWRPTAWKPAAPAARPQKPPPPAKQAETDEIVLEPCNCRPADKTHWHCCFCLFSSKKGNEAVYEHIERFHEEMITNCTECTILFKSVEGRDTHYIETHKYKRRGRAPAGQNEAQGQYAYRMDANRQSDSVGNPDDCTSCVKMRREYFWRFSLYPCLCSSRRGSHFHCPDQSCGETVTGNEGLVRRHLRDAHSMEFGDCRTCDSSFMRNRVLSEHDFTFRNEKSGVHIESLGNNSRSNEKEHKSSNASSGGRRPSKDQKFIIGGMPVRVSSDVVSQLVLHEQQTETIHAKPRSGKTTTPRVSPRKRQTSPEPQPSTVSERCSRMTSSWTLQRSSRQSRSSVMTSPETTPNAKAESRGSSRKRRHDDENGDNGEMEATSSREAHKRQKTTKSRPKSLAMEEEECDDRISTEDYWRFFQNRLGACACGMYFLDNQLFYIHRNMHNRTSPLTCSSCYRVCKNSNDFIKHTHTGHK